MIKAKYDRRGTADLLRLLIKGNRVLTPQQWHQLFFYLRSCYGKIDVKELDLNLRCSLLLTDELGLQGGAVVAHLLEPLVQKKLVSLQEVASCYGEDVSRLLFLLHRIGGIYQTTPSVTSEHFCHFMFSLAEDIRVVLILLARRLQLLRVAEFCLSASEQGSLAAEVSFLYAPIAHRLGLYGIKSEMEDLCLKYTDRENYDFIKEKIAQTKASRDIYVESFIAPLKERLSHTNLNYTIKGRTKSISSIRNKLKKKKVSFEEIYDLFAIRIVIDSPLEQEREQCWQVYSIITDLYQPNPQRHKDWISIPKSNGYESLHITVLGPEKRWVEVQIRTKRMDEVAEKGVAAHWRYKGIRSESGFDEIMTNLRSILENNRGEEVIQDFKLDLYDEEIYLFTPKGDLVKLPKGATVLDFAYQIHTKVGNQVVSARVNGQNTPLRHVLCNGDTVEIITAKNQQPKPDWLNIAVTGKARSKIRSALRSQNEDAIRLEKEELERRLRNRKISYDESLFIRLIKKLGYKQTNSFYLDVSKGKISLNDFLENYKKEMIAVTTGETEKEQEKLRAEDYVIESVPAKTKQQNDEVLLIDANLIGIEYQFAKCCTPIYGDKIFAFMSNSGLKIHRMDCPNASDLFCRYGYRVIKSEWNNKKECYKDGHDATIKVIGHDDISVINNISSQLTKEEHVALRSFRVNSEDGLFVGYFDLHVQSVGALTSVLKKLRTTKGVKNVERL